MIGIDLQLVRFGMMSMFSSQFLEALYLRLRLRHYMRLSTDVEPGPYLS